MTEDELRKEFYQEFTNDHNEARRWLRGVHYEEVFDWFFSKLTQAKAEERREIVEKIKRIRNPHNKVYDRGLYDGHKRAKKMILYALTDLKTNIEGKE